MDSLLESMNTSGTSSTSVRFVSLLAEVLWYGLCCCSGLVLYASTVFSESVNG